MNGGWDLFGEYSWAQEYVFSWSELWRYLKFCVWECRQHWVDLSGQVSSNGSGSWSQSSLLCQELQVLAREELKQEEILFRQLACSVHSAGPHPAGWLAEWGEGEGGLLAGWEGVRSGVWAGRARQAGPLSVPPSLPALATHNMEHEHWESTKDTTLLITILNPTDSQLQALTPLSDLKSCNIDADSSSYRPRLESVITVTFFWTVMKMSPCCCVLQSAIRKELHADVVVVVVTMSWSWSFSGTLSVVRSSALLLPKMLLFNDNR